MATAPWWWVPLITVIGTPLLGALLYFCVPLLQVAKYWLTQEPYWWVSQILVALLVGGAILYSGKHIDDLRAARERVAADHQHDLDRDIAASQARHAERLENLDLSGSFPRKRAYPARSPDLTYKARISPDLISKVPTSAKRISSTQRCIILTSAPHPRMPPT